MTPEKLMGLLIKDKRFREFIISANTNDQLFDDGIDSTGKSLGVYSAYTIEDKKRKGLPFNHVTLFEEGNLHKSWRVFLDKNKDVVIDSDLDTEKYGQLIDKYGESIMGLTEENLQRLRSLVRIILKEKIQRTFFKKAA